jgi:hypothetical protein
VAELRLNAGNHPVRAPETPNRKYQGQLSHVPLRCHPLSLSNPKSTIKSIERVR